MTHKTRVNNLVGAFGSVVGYEESGGLVRVVVGGQTLHMTRLQFERQFGGRGTLHKADTKISVYVCYDNGDGTARDQNGNLIPPPSLVIQ